MLNLSASSPPQDDRHSTSQDIELVKQSADVNDYGLEQGEDSHYVELTSMQNYIAANTVQAGSQDGATAEKDVESSPAEGVTIQEALDLLKEEWAKRPDPGSPWREWIGYIVGAIGLLIALFRGNRPKKE